VTIVVAQQAQAVEREAARELVGYLQQLYPSDRFVLSGEVPAVGQVILVGNAVSDEQVRKRLPTAPQAAESYRIVHRNEGGRAWGIIAGADPRGTAYGVYALLNRLGYGFYLSGDAAPPPRQEAFSCESWDLADRPLVADRLVFDWHNFLSGCSTWNLRDWQLWICQSQKMGYNAVMVHAYGNNPMVSFTFQGKVKPVGYLSTTAKGRDWSTPHVNDVRRLWGGEVFDQPVFGSDAALVADDRRADAARELMQQVFACAEQRGMDVYFADDVDTVSANPQELIQLLPPHARFRTSAQMPGFVNPEADGTWLANPETPEGYAYYRAQVDALLTAYPQITCLVLWFRTGRTPWTDLIATEMPAAWQREYAAEIAKTPPAAELWQAPQIFAISKIVRACDRALRELGHERVRLASGSWDFKFLAAAHRFFPPHVKLIGLDYNVLHDKPQLADDESRRVIRDVAAERPVIPVVWAHHDDGNYIGRPYTPFADFHAKLTDARACGFGIIHWTTRPLDLYFLSHIRQVWESTRNQPLRAVCEEMAERSFGTAARGPLGEYLERWVCDAPKFARETSDFFIDRTLVEIPQIVAGCRQRLRSFDGLDLSALTAAQRDRLEYYRGLEEYISAFHQTQDAFQRSQASLQQGDRAGARAAIAEAHPEQVIEQFARFSSLGGITRGEQGLVVSQNLRWLTYYVRQRQLLGLEPVRYNFAPTSHDPLAQSRGTFTFHFDADHHVWETWGAQETGTEIWRLPDDRPLTRPDDLPPTCEEICRAGMESDHPVTLILHPIVPKRNSQPRKTPGVSTHAAPYRLRLWMLDPSSTAAGQRVFVVAVDGTPIRERIDIFAKTGAPCRVLEQTYAVNFDPTASLTVTLTPEIGKALLCGIMLEPMPPTSEPKQP
jgi:hypothetical protein